MISLVGLWFVTLLLIAVNFIQDFAFGYKGEMNINQSWGMFNLALFCTILHWSANMWRTDNEKDTYNSGKTHS